MTTTQPTEPQAEEQRALEAAGVLARASTAFRHCLDEVQAADDAAWAAYSQAAREAIAHLQADLVLAGARLSAERAEDPEQARKAAEAASHLARQRLETLRVQAHLGAMDVDSLAERAVEELEHVARGLRDRSRRLQHAATGSVEDARRVAADAIHDARRALLAVVAAASSGDITFDGDPDER